MAHHDHDPLLIAALVDGDSDAPVTDERARRLIAECADCATLHADLIALAAASRALPAPAIRTRDFRLSAADAARLRPSGWRRVIVAFGSPRDGLTRPLAAGLTTLGLAGLLIGTIPSGLFGAASGAAPEHVFDAQSGAEEPEASPATDRLTSTDGGELGQREGDRLPLILLSSGFLAGGLGLAGARIVVARRRGNRSGREAV
jgi:anti-sigma factor RsiW